MSDTTWCNTHECSLAVCEKAHSPLIHGLVPVSWDRLITLFDKELIPALHELGEKPGVEHVVVFTNQTLDASQMGYRTAVVVGPSYTWKSLGEVAKAHLGDAPSRFQYPTHVWSKG